LSAASVDQELSSGQKNDTGEYYKKIFIPVRVLDFVHDSCPTLALFIDEISFK